MTERATTPVLLLLFKRPEVTARMLRSVRRAEPLRLYVAADGPRGDVPGDREACEEVRRIATEIDWPCRVQTLFREKNLGLRSAVSGALDWFFGQESEGIVLEDDCVPSSSFFPFCTELLERYRDDDKVMAISGANFQFGAMETPYSYYFSRYNHCWGWAGWRRAWRHYDHAMTFWPEVRETDRLEQQLGSKQAARYWTAAFDSAYRNEVESWAYRWTLSVWLAEGVTALPRENLVSNIGFGGAATHTLNSSPLDSMEARELDFPLKHPPSLAVDEDADRRTFDNCYRPPTLAGRFRSRLARLLSS